MYITKRMKQNRMSAQWKGHRETDNIFISNGPREGKRWSVEKKRRSIKGSNTKYSVRDKIQPSFG